MLSLILSTMLMSFLPGGAQAYGMAVSPISWSSSAQSCIGAPAGLVRIEAWEAAGGGFLPAQWNRGGEGNSDFSVFASGGGGIGSLSVGGGIYHSRRGGYVDSTAVNLGLAKVLTGDPVAFLEGFFGPSISLGASLTLLRTSGEDPETRLQGASGLQFAVFPTFSIGAGVSEFDILADSDSTDSGKFIYGLSYIFNRSLRGHLSVEGGDLAIGTDLRVSPLMTIRAGTDLDSWSTGVRLRIGRAGIDYGVRLTEDNASHILSLTMRIGKRPW